MKHALHLKSRSIALANPNEYYQGFDTQIDSLLNDKEVIVIQKGFNPGRSAWNKEHAEKINNNINIEQFEIKWLKK